METIGLILVIALIFTAMTVFAAKKQWEKRTVDEVIIGDFKLEILCLKSEIKNCKTKDEIQKLFEGKYVDIQTRIDKSEKYVRDYMNVELVGVIGHFTGVLETIERFKEQGKTL